MKIAGTLLLLMACGALGKNILPPDLLNRSGRIINGSPVDISELPSMASLQYSASSQFSHNCGATILTIRTLLSAAHCFMMPGMDVPQNWRIRAGSSIQTSGGVYIQMDRIYDHPNFHIPTLGNDISVLRLASPLPLGQNIAQVSIPAQNSPISTGTLVIVAGWGITGVGQGPSQILLETTLQIVDQNECARIYGASVVTENVVCAGWPYEHRGVGSADSGGPLFAHGLQHHRIHNSTQHGVTSFGSSNGPDGFVRVPKFTSWIVETSDFLISS